MNVIVAGAGAVGAVVGTLLAADGHEVSFWVRPAQRARLRELSIERVGGASYSLASPRCLSAGDAVPPSDWVLICVRGEQLDAALAEVARHMGSARRVAVAAVSLESVTDRARRAGLEAPAFALHASFGSFVDDARPTHFHFHPFDLPTTVTPDGDGSRMRDARELARALVHAGLPARARRSMTTAMTFLVAENSVLALGWDLCDWDLPRLSRDRDVRRATALAMHEASRLALPERSPFRLLPVFLYDGFLRVFPLLMGERGRAVWRRHGPKIRAQTDDVARQLLSRADESGRVATALAQLFERWRATFVERSGA